MKILTLKTDNPAAEIGLYENTNEIAHVKWQGHRQLSATIHSKIEETLKSKNLDWQDIEAVVFFAGPGSFTGLRIGASVASTLASGLGVPVVSQKGADWVAAGISKLESGVDGKAALPFYGGRANITKPKK